jgi:hypothetical protein
MWLLIVASVYSGTVNWEFQQFDDEILCKTAIVGMYQMAARTSMPNPAAMCFRRGYVDVQTLPMKAKRRAK